MVDRRNSASERRRPLNVIGECRNTSVLVTVAKREETTGLQRPRLRLYPRMRSDQVGFVFALTRLSGLLEQRSIMEERPKESSASCKQSPGKIIPIVNLGRCEGKADCVAVCPEDVFEIRRINGNDYAELTVLQRLKQRVHGMKVAYTPRADACRSCGLCVPACPENAITLERSDWCGESRLRSA